MKEFLKHFYQKHKYYKTKDLKLGLRCSALKTNKTDFFGHPILKIKPKRFNILKETDEHDKFRYVEQHFGKHKTSYGNCPNFDRQPTFYAYSHTCYNCPAHKNEALLGVKHVHLTGYNNKVEDNREYEFILENTIPLNEALGENIELAKRISLRDLLDLEHMINKEELEKEA